MAYSKLGFHLGLAAFTKLPHDSREIPVWGPIFHQIGEDQDFGNVRLQNLIKYLETIQQK